MKQITLYTYNELSDNAKKQAIDKKRFDVMYEVMEHWNTEWLNSLNRFEEITNTELKSYDVSYDGFYCGNIDFKDDVLLGSYEFPLYADEIKGKLLFRYLNNNILPYIQKNKIIRGKSSYIDGKYHIPKRTSRIITSDDECTLTGYIGDIPLVRTIIDYCKEWNKHPEKTLEDLYRECYRTFLQWWHDDFCGFDNDEYVAEELENGSAFENVLYYENGEEF